jgi:hypothetical protein
LYDEILYGGAAGGGKSVVGCIWLTQNCIRYPNSRWFLARKTLKDLKSSSLLTFFETAEWFGLQANIDYVYNAQDSVITFKNKSRIFLLEVDSIPSDPQFNRLGSKEYTGGFVEEAQETQEIAIDVLQSRCRFLTKKYGLIGTILLTCNPSKGYLHQRYYKPFIDGTMPEHRAFIQSLPNDNPYLPDNYRQKLANIKDEAIKQRLLFGNWDYENNNNQVVLYQWLESSLIDERPLEPKKRRIGVDLANEGEDKSVIALWEDNVLVDLHKIDIPITQQTDISGDIANYIMDYCIQRQIGYEAVSVDAVGVGVGVRDALRGRGWYVDAYKGGEAVEQTGEDFVSYRNLRTYSYWQLRMGLQNNTVKILRGLPFMDELFRELTAHVYSTDEKVIILEKKDEVKKKIGHSPDYSDAVVMGFAPQPTYKVSLV